MCSYTRADEGKKRRQVRNAATDKKDRKIVLIEIASVAVLPEQQNSDHAAELD